MLIADVYNKSWVRGKMQRGTQVIQRLAAITEAALSYKAAAHHPQHNAVADGYVRVQRMEDVAEKVAKPS